jgi:hypothetical protein
MSEREGWEQRDKSIDNLDIGRLSRPPPPPRPFYLWFHVQYNTQRSPFNSGGQKQKYYLTPSTAALPSYRRVALITNSNWDTCSLHIRGSGGGRSRYNSHVNGSKSWLCNTCMLCTLYCGILRHGGPGKVLTLFRKGDQPRGWEINELDRQWSG